MMTHASWVVFCLSYIFGLFSSNFATFYSPGFSKQQLLVSMLIAVGGSFAITLVQNIVEEQIPLARINFPKLYRKCRIKFLIGITGAILAIIYLQLRIPQPKNNDISYQISSGERPQVTITAKVLTEPRLTNSHRLKFLVRATQISRIEDQKEMVSGKLYATLPLLQGTGIKPGMALQLKGMLYLPQSANITNGFDFKAYLARQGIFAGIQGIKADFKTEPGWGWWQLRQRILRSHLQSLGSPIGQLVTSMVLGRKAVDLPEDIRDRFIAAGLAHVLAASGFHVSLLLGLILRFTVSLANKPRLIIGIGTLITYLGLTGLQASVFRACLMGIGILIALVKETKIKPLGSLLLAATIILLFNPLFIGDLGFQLSFLATFGLIVTMPGLQKRLDWLPTTMATLIAVPLAASIWVLPLISYEFNSIATFSLIVNIVCTPLIVLISLGGMISAIASLTFPLLGSAIAWLLLYPTLLLINIINFFTNLPGSNWATGQISLVVLLTIYSLFLLVWLNQFFQRRLQLVLLSVGTLLILPMGYNYYNLTQITILATRPEPLVVVQDRGRAILINSDNVKAAKYDVLPFLARQGINQIDYDINLKSHTASKWAKISDQLSIKHKLTYSQNNEPIKQSKAQKIITKSYNISYLNQLSALRLETATHLWLILTDFEPKQADIARYLKQAGNLAKPLVLVTKNISPVLLQLQPQIIIFSSQFPGSQTTGFGNIQLLNLRRDGAIYWTAKDQIQPVINQNSQGDRLF